MDQWKRIKNPEINLQSINLQQRKQEYTMEKKTISSGTGLIPTSSRYSSVEESACNARDGGLISGLGRSSGGEKGNLLQYTCL